MRDLPAFQGAPQFGKLAVDGVWERAVTFEPGRFTKADEVRPLLGDARDVACEAFFGDAFFGVRRRDGDLAQFVVTFATVMAAPVFFDAVREVLGVPLEERFTYAELGAEGAWRSVGAVRIDDPDAPSLWERVEVSPVGRDISHPKALEFVFDNGDGTTHWFALPVSEDGRLVRERFEAALSQAAVGRAT